LLLSRLGVGRQPTGRLRFARARAYVPGMDDLTYWTESLRQAEQELDAAKTGNEVNQVAKKFQRAKAELKALKVETGQTGEAHADVRFWAALWPIAGIYHWRSGAGVQSVLHGSRGRL
jgi:hypothetical protein